MGYERFEYRLKPDTKTGLALVLNYVDFKNLEKRDGSHADVANIKIFLEQYNFELFESLQPFEQNLNSTENLINACARPKGENCTKQETLALIEEYCNDLRHVEYSCSIVFILTHGDKRGLCMADSDHSDDASFLPLDEIIHKFKNVNCPHLNGKPKLFFVQACRGLAAYEGCDVYYRRNISVVSYGSNDERSPSTNRNPPSFRADCPMNWSKTFVLGQKIATGADFYVAFSTLPGEISARDEEMGSLFIQAICKIFPMFSDKDDLLSLMTKVIQEVSEKEWMPKENLTGGQNDKFNIMTAPQQCSQLTKKFYFPYLSKDAL